eukprot:2128823-Alexandrium_andersonii.AAC.1
MLQAFACGLLSVGLKARTRCNALCRFGALGWDLEGDPNAVPPSANLPKWTSPFGRRGVRGSSGVRCGLRHCSRVPPADVDV